MSLTKEHGLEAKPLGGDREQMAMENNMITEWANLLVDRALRVIPQMLVEGRASFCEELRDAGGKPEYNPKKSARYSLITLIGLSRAQAAGRAIPLDISRFCGEIWHHRSHLRLGDLGLFLWLGKRTQFEKGLELVGTVQERLKACEVDLLEGQELAWLITGLSQWEDHSEAVARTLVDHVRETRVAPSGLFYHVGRGARRRFPNFATQIYTIHALSVRARVVGDVDCARLAVRAADLLGGLQRQNGGWPWLYDAEKGRVVEPFEIYSVHQDAMAPMAFWELNSATGYGVQEIIRRGLQWLSGENELGVDMLQSDQDLIHRSIRRKGRLGKLALYIGTAAHSLGFPFSLPADPGRIEVNRSCRPYHLGWILEAWCGRESSKNTAGKGKGE